MDHSHKIREFKQIEYNCYYFTSSNVDIDSDIHNSNELSILPSFSDVGNPHLFQCLTLSSKPGHLIQSIQKLSDRFRNSSDPDLNWVGWLDYHFDQYENLADGFFSSPEQINYLQFRTLIVKLIANDSS